MPEPGIKKEAHRIVDELPDDATWEELEYRIHVRRKIERGRRDIEEGRTLTTEEVRQRLGLESE